VARRAIAWLLWWAGSWLAFQLLAGDWNRIEWVGGACVATVAATLADAIRTAARVEPRLPLAQLRALPSALAAVVVDFGLLVVALVRRRPGRYVVRELEPTAAAQQGPTVLVSGLSPNAFVVELDADRGTVLLHDLVPRRASERPA
jgi:hypothetical protein